MTGLPDQNPDILLVPSAIIVPDELRLDVGSIPTGMIPLRGKPMLDRIAEVYAEHNVTNVVAVHAASDSIRQYTSRSEYNWTVIDVGETSTLGETIAQALNKLGPANLVDRGLYINFADTLTSPTLELNESDYVSYQSADRTYRWTTFDVENSRIDQITQKYERSESSPKPAFTGQFGISDADAFHDTLTTVTQSRERDIPLFYEALFAYLSCRKYELYEPETWLDVGHLDTYHRTKKRFLNAREFNEIEVDEKNVVTKRSEDTKTLINEIEWYRKIPTALQPYLPRLYEWSTDRSAPYLKMEYIGYPSLADLQLYGSHGQHIWNSVFHRTFSMLNEFRDHTAPAESATIENSLRKIYIDKTRRRLARLRNTDQFVRYFEADEVLVNGRPVPSVGSVLTQLEEVVSDENLLDQEELSIIHGDLCLPNILYDPRNEILKLIDPRGEFGMFTIYGDPRYDLAKLRHSLVGHYEHLINGQFTASADSTGTEINYEIETNPAQEMRESRFDTLLETQTATRLREVKLIEALLFLSMVPLHDDSYERQICMLGQGLEKISPYLD